jgi:hypothetical protein
MEISKMVRQIKARRLSYARAGGKHNPVLDADTLTPSAEDTANMQISSRSYDHSA